VTTPAGPDRSSTGVDPSLVAALAYVLGALTGVIVLALERESRFVRFHATQSIVFSLAVMVLTLILSGLPVGGRFLMWVTSISAVGIWIFLMVQAILGKPHKLPFIGRAIDDQLR
jgi:uncharacterized membrane protein